MRAYARACVYVCRQVHGGVRVHASVLFDFIYHLFISGFPIHPTLHLTDKMETRLKGMCFCGWLNRKPSHCWLLPSFSDPFLFPCKLMCHFNPLLRLVSCAKLQFLSIPPQGLFVTSSGSWAQHCPSPQVGRRT